jgi:hypothetical protein
MCIQNCELNFFMFADMGYQTLGFTVTGLARVY